MNIIFLTISRFYNVNMSTIYTDLMRKFRDEGHNVYVVTPLERKFNLETHLEQQERITILGVKTLNIQKSNNIEKGIGTLLIDNQFKVAINQYLGNIFFDIILYSTPPITLLKVINYLKHKNPRAKTYLMLKDIFPQNAVDLGLFKKSSAFYKFFRKKEVNLYKSSDFIGCMSPENIKYVIDNNEFINPKSVEICPNSIEIKEFKNPNRNDVLRKYGLSVDKKIFIYGGNLGKPQGIEFIIKCLTANLNRDDVHFVIVGDGTDYYKINSWMNENKPNNCSVFKTLPPVVYKELVGSCDVGLIFLDYRFTIPNFPSRLLDYLVYKLPIIIASDSSCDLGNIANENGFGYCCPSNDVDSFTDCVNKMLKSDQKKMGENGYAYLKQNYSIENTYNAIVKHVQ